MITGIQGRRLSGEESLPHHRRSRPAREHGEPNVLLRGVERVHPLDGPVAGGGERSRKSGHMSRITTNV